MSLKSTQSSIVFDMSKRKRLYIKTFGCQMNFYDSERMMEAFAPLGYEQTEDAGDADVIVLNTCHIREKAAEKVYSELGRIRQIKAKRRQDGKRTMVAVAGCVAQAEGNEIIRRAQVVDLVVGPQSYYRLPDLLFRACQEGRRIVDTEFPEKDKFTQLPARIIRKSCTAFLTVQEGCDKFCTFCVVPYTRGMEFSRPVEALYDEASRLVDGGVRELTLLGQNVNAYHGIGRDNRQWSLAQLLARLAEIDGLQRLRYTTSHPRDMSDDLIAAHRDNHKLMPYLHLPFQAGSDRILAGMNRKHTSAQYLDIVARIRDARPDIALSTDIIVGFPGESDEEFEATLAIVRQVGFAQAFSFKYSPRPGTPAAALDEQVSDEAKSERLARLQEFLSADQRRFNEGFVGATMSVLFEKQGRHNGQIVGRSPYLQPVHASGGDQLIGRTCDVEISGAGPNSLAGVIKAARLGIIQAEAGA